MPLRIFTNVSSIIAQRHLGKNALSVGSSIERLAQGKRIAKAADDVAGLSISEGIRSDVRALRQAVKNANDGISLINVAEGALNEQAAILIRLRELSSQAASGTIGATERQTLQLEFSALRSEIDRISNTTEFNGQKLLDGSLSSSVILDQHITLQVGIDTSTDSRLDLNSEIDLEAVSAINLGISTNSVLTTDQALESLERIDSAVNTITSSRGKVGSIQNRLDRTLATLNVTIENLTAADATIRDADIAEEVALLARNQILSQASISMVSQSNLLPQSVLGLI